MPAAVLPPARFMAASPACSWLTLIPADAASALSWGAAAAADLLALAADAFAGAGLADGEPTRASTSRCAIAGDTPVDEAKAAMPAAVLPPARFMAASPDCSWLTLIPADAASAFSWGAAAAADLLALAADAFAGVGLADGELGPDANAAAGTVTAIVMEIPATARRWRGTNTRRSSLRMGFSQVHRRDPRSALQRP